MTGGLELKYIYREQILNDESVFEHYICVFSAKLNKA